VLQGFARLLIFGGLVVLVLAVVTDWRWTAQPITLAALRWAPFAMRMSPGPPQQVLLSHPDGTAGPRGAW
jgi:hypothetical protein